MTMNTYVYICAIGFLQLIKSAARTTLETVWIKDVTTSKRERILSTKGLPNELAFQLRRGSAIISLHLRRNHDINPNADFYFVRQLKNGQFALVKSPNLESKDVAYYQDGNNLAFITVRCVKRANNHCDRIITGNIRIGDSLYDVRPAEIDVISRNMLEVPGVHGQLYVLRDLSRSQRDIFAEMKDVTSVARRTINEDREGFLRRSEGHHAQNISRRQEKIEYNVKVAVMIDPGLWDFYSSMVSILNPLHKRRKVMENIRKSFSHIINGVNLLYKGIEDPNISINVVLADFITFKLKAFPHKLSKPVVVNGTKYIDASEYLKDAEEWDRVEGKKNSRAFDTGILFTRYILHRNSMNKYLNGLTTVKGVCDTGNRIALVEARGLFWTIFIAAHELGHSLGAEHDGEKGANYCNAAAHFIMTGFLADMRTLRASRNAWRFSECSVRAFKDTLKKKKCVTEPYSLYDTAEYTSYMQNEPGEIYTRDDQCRLMFGRHSTCCETGFQNVCDSMRCTKPSTGECMPKHHVAVRGTECGRAKALTCYCRFVDNLSAGSGKTSKSTLNNFWFDSCSA